MYLVSMCVSRIWFVRIPIVNSWPTPTIEEKKLANIIVEIIQSIYMVSKGYAFWLLILLF